MSGSPPASPTEPAANAAPEAAPEPPTTPPSQGAPTSQPTSGTGAATEAASDTGAATEAAADRQASPARARLFVAVWPPPDVVDAIAALARPDLPGLRWTRPDQWHVTLVFLGTSDVEPTVERFRQAVLPPGPVTATLGPATGRFGRRIVHAPVAGLDGVAAAVRAVLPGEDERPFTGHLTLARAKGPVDLSSVVGVRLSASFRVDEVTLVLSELGRGPGGGARYRVVERLAL